MKHLWALKTTGGVLSKENSNPSIKYFVDSLKKMCSTYAKRNWKPIPIAQGVWFQFPSIGGLELLTKSAVIPYNNDHFIVKRWEEENGSKKHNFPIMVALLAFNMPSSLRSEPEISKMIEGFAHLIEATHLYEGGPIKLIVGCQGYDDVPKEIPVVFGGKEYTMALAMREIVHNRRTRKENIDLIHVNKKRSNFTCLAPAKVAGGEKKVKEQENGSRNAAEGSG